MNHSGSMHHLFRVYLNCSGWIQDPVTIQFQGITWINQGIEFTWTIQAVCLIYSGCTWIVQAEFRIHLQFNFRDSLDYSGHQFFPQLFRLYVNYSGMLPDILGPGVTFPQPFRLSFSFSGTWYEPHSSLFLNKVSTLKAKASTVEAILPRPRTLHAEEDNRWRLTVYNKPIIEHLLHYQD